MRIEDCFKGEEKICKIWKKIPELDAEIRVIEKTKKFFENGRDLFVVEFGTFESLGERAGDIHTLPLNHMPTEEEIRKAIRSELKEEKNELSSTDILSGREEMQLEVLRRINL